jgi:hypothetical protein
LFARDLQLPFLKAIEHVAEQIEVFLVVSKEVLNMTEIYHFVSLQRLDGSTTTFNMVF